jgi:hypothetical protein
VMQQVRKDAMKCIYSRQRINPNPEESANKASFRNYPWPVYDRSRDMNGDDRFVILYAMSQVHPLNAQAPTLGSGRDGENGFAESNTIHWPGCRTTKYTSVFANSASCFAFRKTVSVRRQTPGSCE